MANNWSVVHTHYYITILWLRVYSRSRNILHWTVLLEQLVSLSLQGTASTTSNFGLGKGESDERLRQYLTGEAHGVGSAVPNYETGTTLVGGAQGNTKNTSSHTRDPNHQSGSEPQSLHMKYSLNHITHINLIFWMTLHALNAQYTHTGNEKYSHLQSIFQCKQHPRQLLNKAYGFQVEHFRLVAWVV